jgi:hypothetical protein
MCTADKFNKNKVKLLKLYRLKRQKGSSQNLQVTSLHTTDMYGSFIILF